MPPLTSIPLEYVDSGSCPKHLLFDHFVFDESLKFSIEFTGASVKIVGSEFGFLRTADR